MITPRRRTLGIVFSLATAFCYGLTHLLAKKGVSELANPVMGTGIALLAGLIVLFAAGPGKIYSPIDRARNSKKGILLLALAGVTAFLGVLTQYAALGLAPVVTVAPLTATNPLVTIVMAYFWLQRSEKVTGRLVLSAMLIITGGILIVSGTQR